jgi:hypothetical protein
MDLAVVSAPSSNSTYVYYLDSFNTWTQQAILTSLCSNQLVEVRNNTVLIGARQYDKDQGAVFVYNARETTFAPTAQPTSVRPSASPTLFPTQTSTWVETAVVGASVYSGHHPRGESCRRAPRTSNKYAVTGKPIGGSLDSGEIYVYESTDYGTTWYLFTNVSAASTNTSFGQSVSIISGTVAVGAPTTCECTLH